MSDPRMLTAELDADLRAYFAVTASTVLSPKVRAMSVRTLQERGSGRRVARFAGAFGLVAAAALAFVVIAHPGSQRASSTNSSFSAMAGPEGPAVARPLPGSIVAYPGVDGSMLAATGVVLLAPDVRGAVALSAAQAQVAATQALGRAAGHPGPAVLATVHLPSGQLPSTCLCWLVDVPVAGVEAATAGAAPATHTELVLVDATDGRIVAALTGHGIP